MKSKEVIRLLQELDPDGETEVCVGNMDIDYIECLPAYYDGTLQVLQRDESKDGYNIKGKMMSESDLWEDALNSLYQIIENYEGCQKRISDSGWIPVELQTVEKTIETLKVINFLNTSPPTSIVFDPCGGIIIDFNNKEITFHNDGEIALFEYKDKK